MQLVGGKLCQQPPQVSHVQCDKLFGPYQTTWPGQLMCRCPAHRHHSPYHICLVFLDHAGALTS